MSRSDELFARARRVTPGGVHSPVRSFRGVDGTPVFIESANGATLVDVDGGQYVDFCMSFGPLILGHRPAAVEAAVERAIRKGWTYGTAERTSLELAELVVEHIDWVDQVRFVNSGTEAVMSALRLARAATGRDRVLKFDGCYHGHADAMLIGAGSGLASQPIADSAGIAEGVARDTLVAPLDDSEYLEQVFAEYGDSLAAAIIEPVPANYGLLPQRPEFLKRLAELCELHGALLVFDEVISGFRLAFGGFAELSGIRPDLVTWGKIIGGGFPVGGIAGRRALLEQFAPHGPVYQAGTLSANPVAMAAGRATLEALLDGGVYRRLEMLGQRLEATVSGCARLRMQRCGSLFWLVADDVPGDGTIRSRTRIPAVAADGYRRLFRAALNDGIYLAPSAWEVGFLSAAHTPDDIDRLAGVLGEFDAVSAA